MKKLSTILLTILFMGITFTSSFASCESFVRNPLSMGNIRVIYKYYGGNSGTVTGTSPSGSVLTPNTTESIISISKPISTLFDSDYLILQGSLEVMSVGDEVQDNANAPTISNLSAPIIANSDISSDESYCDVIGFMSNPADPTYLGDYNATSQQLTPRLASYTFTLKCHRNQNFPLTRNYYRINFFVSLNNFYNDGYTLNTPYRVSVIFRDYSLSVSDSCTNEQIIETLDSVNDSITDLNDSITDTNISNSVTELEDQLEDWSVNNHGLSAFVTAPLSFISSLAQQDTCTPISLPALLGNSSTFVLPCIMEEFEDKFPTLFAIYQIAIYFFVCYRIGIDLFRTVHKLKDPLNDEISVADI